MTEREQLRADIKKWLKSYGELEAERQQLLQEIERVENAMYSPTGSKGDGMPRRPGVSNPVERVTLKHSHELDRLKRQYRAQIDKLASAQIAIEEAINGLEPTERRLARFRYIDGLEWLDICERIGYEWAQTHRIHSGLLNKLIDAELERRNAEK